MEDLGDQRDWLVVDREGMRYRKPGKYKVADFAQKGADGEIVRQAVAERGSRAIGFDNDRHCFLLERRRLRELLAEEEGRRKQGVEGA